MTTATHHASVRPSATRWGQTDLHPDSILTTAEVVARWERQPRADPMGVDQTNGLFRVARGAWVDSALWESLPPWARALARHYAVQKVMPEPPIFCLASAALLWHVPVLQVPVRPQVIAGAQRGSRRFGRPVVGKVWPLEGSDVDQFEGFHLTSLARTAVDCARELPVREGLVVADGYLRRTAGFESQATLLEQLGRSTTRRGVVRARQVIEMADGRSESAAETLTRLVLVQNNLKGFVPQYPITLGGERFRMDFAWERERLVLEFDGDLKYTGEFGDPAEVIRAERRREKLLTNAGWRVIRVNWVMVTRTPEVLVDLVRRELAARH